MKLTGIERTFDVDEIIVTKTDLKGRIIYANEVFLRMVGYTERQVLGQPHSIVRHPDMPRCAFKLVWHLIESGQEAFAYVKNLASTGDHYWVFAHITPTFDKDGKIVSYHSNRRKPRSEAVAVIEGIYRELLGVEQAASDPKQGMETAFNALVAKLQSAGVSYDEFVCSL